MLDDTVYDLHESGDGRSCPLCNHVDTHCLEYDDDSDLYTMQCDNEDCSYQWLAVDSTETWK